MWKFDDTRHPIWIYPENFNPHLPDPQLSAPASSTTTSSVRETDPDEIYPVTPYFTALPSPPAPHTPATQSFPKTFLKMPASWRATDGILEPAKES